jgi:formylglycine-generating enzyme required for sulfatase activity
MFKGGLLDLVSSTPEGFKTSFQSILPEFGLASTEVTQREFARFLAENPDWKPENRTALIEKGLADSSYLKDFDLAAAADNRPITGVSWYAANAYCQWLNRQAPAGYEVVLPTEAMWEAAAAVSSRRISSLGIFKSRTSTGPLPVGSAGTDSLSFSDLFGNVWEWTSDGFRPYAWIQKDSPAFNELIGAISQKTVKGGSWANSPDQISIDSRGPVPAAHGSEFLGFRPALRKK